MDMSLLLAPSEVTIIGAFSSTSRSERFRQRIITWIFDPALSEALAGPGVLELGALGAWGSLEAVRRRFWDGAEGIAEGLGLVVVGRLEAIWAAAMAGFREHRPGAVGTQQSASGLVTGTRLVTCPRTPVPLVRLTSEFLAVQGVLSPSWASAKSLLGNLRRHARKFRLVSPSDLLCLISYFYLHRHNIYLPVLPP